jgi:phage shock protein A
MKVQLDAQVKAVDQLKGNTRMLENKLSEAKSKKDTLKARAKSASTSKQINEMLQGLNTSSASSAFDRMEEKVMALEGESEAAMQVMCTHAHLPELTSVLTLTVVPNKVLGSSLEI